MLKAKLPRYRAKAYIDNGVNANFITSIVVSSNKLPYFLLAATRSLRLADRSPTAKRITYYALVNLELNGHYEQLLMYVANLQYDIVLGMP